MAKGTEYWARDAGYPRKVHIQTSSFRKALHTAVEKAERLGKQINVQEYERDPDGFWEETDAVWKVSVS